MSTLTQFHEGLLKADLPVPEGLQDANGNPAERRYGVYRNNVTVSLIQAMKTAFPLVQNLIGAQNFDGIAPLYVRNHPPTSPVMSRYGSDFPSFLSGFEPLAHIGYLPDAARLDLALRQSYHAADCTALTAETLQSLPPERLIDTQITLAPATVILRSDWPLFDIWRYNFEEGAPKPAAVAQDVLITRPAFDPKPHPLPSGAADWLQTLDNGAPFGETHAQTQANHPKFDLSATLSLCLQTQAFGEIAP